MVIHHAYLGEHLLSLTDDAQVRRWLAQSLSETAMLAARIEFFDLALPDDASDGFRRALEAAAVANDSLLGAAVLGHLAFIPGWIGNRDLAEDRLRAAHAYARRASAPATFIAWLKAVEAECQLRCGQPRRALSLIGEAEDMFNGDAESLPDWFNWFPLGQVKSFRGQIELGLGHPHQAQSALMESLHQFESDVGGVNAKQIAVVLADLAAVAVALRRPEEACAHLIRALDLLRQVPYEAAMDRIREVRKSLDESWSGSPAVTELDDRLYDWDTALNRC